MDTPLINKITNKQTNKQKITIKKNDLPSRVFEVFTTRRKKTKTLKGCVWSEATSVMHGYYQTAETRRTFLCQDSR